MRVFVAGPYTANTDDLILCNVLTACKAAAKLVEAGLCPFVPHLSHYIDRCCATYVDYEAWMNQTLQWVDACKCVLRLPGVSPGADREVERASQLGIPVFTTVQEVVDYSKGWGRTYVVNEVVYEVARDEAEDKASPLDDPDYTNEGLEELAEMAECCQPSPQSICVSTSGPCTFTISDVRLY